MSEILERWSAPWHALQHTLAQGLGFEQVALNPRAPVVPTARPVAVGAGTWLARARGLVTPASSHAAT